LIKSKSYYSFRPAHARANRGPGTPLHSSPTHAPRWSRPLISAALGPLPAGGCPTCRCAGPLLLHLAPTLTPSGPPLSSLSASVQAVRAPFHRYHRVELPTAARLTTSPLPLSDQTGAHRPPSTFGEHVPHPDAVSHVDSNLSRGGEQCNRGDSLSICQLW
jgi:hypothetical protein